MAQGSGSAKSNNIVVVAVLLCIIVINFHIAESAIYIVGGGNGWTFTSATWTRGKSFKAGDVLVFNYSPSAHNLVPVSAAGYNGCTAPRGTRALTTGKDRITLTKGTNYFICTFPGHCQAGMKMAVTAI